MRPGVQDDLAPNVITVPPLLPAGSNEGSAQGNMSNVGNNAPHSDPQSILERAKRDIGKIDRALRKENEPVIVLPPDSPQIRLQKGIEHAAEMAPNAWYQAPKTAELVNQTGDGARRTRIITGNGTYCITERAPTMDIQTIEMHGKIKVTNCPKNEAPPTKQEWRTANQ